MPRLTFPAPYIYTHSTFSLGPRKRIRRIRRQGGQRGGQLIHESLDPFLSFPFSLGPKHKPAVLMFGGLRARCEDPSSEIGGERLGELYLHKLPHHRPPSILPLSWLEITQSHSNQPHPRYCHLCKIVRDR